MALNKNEILQANDLQHEALEIPEWGGEILVRGFTAAERDEYEQSLIDARRVGNETQIKMVSENAKARAAVKCIVNDEGERIFTDADADVLGQKSAKALNRIMEKIQNLSGMSEKDMKELAGNSNAAQTADSRSS